MNKTYPRKYYKALWYTLACAVMTCLLSEGAAAGPVWLQTAADIQVSGVVTSAEDGNPLPGVSVVVKGGNSGTTTNSEGRYQLSVPENTTLTFRYIGFLSQDVAVNGRSQINVVLALDQKQLDEVVVIGYGTQRREDVTGAVSSVSSEDFRTNSPRDAASLIKGRIPGLVVSTPTGSPTGGSEITLRGATTITGSRSPLVLIDGIPGDLNTVQPENIESISVLKDGSAAAIYGSRATNGVILITTKMHSGAQPATINYQGYVNTQQIFRRPEFMNAEEYRNAIRDHDANFTDEGNNTDWQSEILQRPTSQNHSLTLSGGGANTNYSANINYTDRNGIILRSDNKNVRGRVNVRHSMYDDRVVANVNINYRTQNSSSINSDAWYQALIRNPTDRIRDEQGNWQERAIFNYNNPLAMIYESTSDNEIRDLRLNGSVAVKPIDNLTLQLLGSSTRWTSLSGYAETFQHFSTTRNNFNGYASRGASASTDNLMEFTGNYSNSIENHTLNVLAGYSYQDVVDESFSMNNRDFPTDLFGYNSIGVGTGLQDGLAGMSSGKSSYKLIGFFGRLNYDFNNRYILMGSLRYEGNSRFGANNQWGVFPGVSAGWRISKERFMEDITVVDELKLRAGYGVTGIAPTDSYLSLSSVGTGGFFLDNGEWIRGFVPTRNPNPDLRWERKDEYNIGLDFAIFDSRLSGSVDAYQRETKDLLFNYRVPTPPYLYNQILANVGQMRNKGLEVAVEYQAFRGSDFTWTSGINYSTNRNQLISLSNEIYQSDNNYFDAGGLGESVQLPTHRIAEGGRIGNFFGYKAVDVDEDGQWIIENAEGERKPYFDINLDDRQVIGNGIPRHNLAWNNTFRYKKLDLQVFLRGAFGFQILNETRLFYENPTQTSMNLLNTAFDPVFGKRTLGNEWQYVDYYLEDGDYVKVDDLTLGYSFSASNYGIRNARIYLSGQNLLTFTGYSGLDPEVNVSGLSPGHDYRNRYPTTRTFTLGVNLNL